MKAMQQDIDERTNLTGTNQFELLLFRLGTDSALGKSELARVWVEQHAKPDMDRDGNWYALMEFERKLIERNPDAAIDLVLEILRIETSPQLLSVLAAGLVEDVISRDTIGRIEREAAADERFRDLLGWVWCSDHGAELRARVEAAARGQHC